MSEATALINRQLKEPIAFITQEVSAINGFKGVISTATFLSHVKALAAKLPEKKHIINLCGNRYLFLVSVCAAVLRKQINLLPPNKNIATQERLAQRYQNAYVLHDGIDVHKDLEQLNLSEINILGYQFDEQLELDAIEQIPLEQLAIISFTSGSTGDSKPNLKTWQTLISSTKINRQYMLSDLKTSYHILLPAPIALVTTPVHLRALVESDLDFPKADIILCATSPLTQDLARRAEQKFQAELREVYGCSEVGSMALRKTGTETKWLKFNGIQFSSNQGKTIASTEYLPAEIELNDRIVLDENNRFELLGRSDDMVDIAGKRGSLTEIKIARLAV